MKKLILTLATCSALSACNTNQDYLADVTKDSHSGCFQSTFNYLGFTNNVTYVHLGDNAAAVNTSPGCAGVTAQQGGPLPSGIGGSSTGVIPANPAPVGKLN